MIDMHPVYSANIQTTAMFAVKQITIHSGQNCSDLAPGRNVFFFVSSFDKYNIDLCT